MIPTGTLLNILAVLLGGFIGLACKNIIQPAINKKIFFIMGVFTLVLGFSMAIQAANFILMLISLILGTIIAVSYTHLTLPTKA